MTPERLERDGYLIRTVEPADLPAVWELHVEGLRDMNTRVDEAHRDPAWDADVRDPITHYLSRGGHFWVVEQMAQSDHPEPEPALSAAERERLIATAALRRIDDTTGDLKRMRVTARHRRRGIGRLLVSVVEDWCRRNAITRIILDTTERQQPAQRLYESLGYTHTHNSCIEPAGLTLLHYEKHLT